MRQEVWKGSLEKRDIPNEYLKEMWREEDLKEDPI